MSISNYFQIKYALWKEQLHVIRRYYFRFLRFAAADLVLGLFSLFVNPYRVCRKYWEKEGASFPFYGETPLSTLEALLRFTKIGPLDTYVELGSGRGKGCFWVRNAIGCRVMGIEKVPYFAKAASLIARLCGSSSLSFDCQDWKKADLSVASYIYLDTTLFSQIELEQIAAKLDRLSRETRIVTVSNPLPSASFRVEKLPFSAIFPWGETEAFLHTKK